MADPGYIEEMVKRLADEGKLLEAGWVAMRRSPLLSHASGPMLEISRISYLAGCQHLFTSIMAMMDPGVMETENDLRRMDLIAKELDGVTQELKLRILPTKGEG
jgi:hypothetical protein